MKCAGWSDAWQVLPGLVGLCRAGDVGALASLLAERQQRGDPPPLEITSPDAFYIHVKWPGGARPSTAAVCSCIASGGD